jgi:peptidoglycan/xylan/chitin deacetylase (PgdA/CDA1 family)
MIGTMRFRAKWLAVHLLHALGLLRLWKLVALRDRAVVLMYHRVLPREAWQRSWSHRGIVVTPETFDRHMRFLREHFQVLSAPEFVKALEAGEGFPPAACLVTFDDGWIDTYTEALPVLRRYGIPALVFLPSAYIGTGAQFWQERMGSILHAIWSRARADAAFAGSARALLARHRLAAVLDLADRDVREGIIEIVRRRKTGDQGDPQEVIRELTDLAGGIEPGSPGPDRFMDWEQIRAMHRDGVDFGAHGVSHRPLTTLSLAELRDEITVVRDSLQSALGQPPATIAYPNGDCDETVLGEVRRGAFSAGFSTRAGLVGASADRFAVRRVNIHEDTTSSLPMFLAKLIRVV